MLTKVPESIFVLSKFIRVIGHSVWSVQSPSAVHGGPLFSSLLYYSYYLFLGNFKFWLITVTTWISFEYVRFINKKSSIKRLRLLILYSILMSPYFFLSNAHLVRQMFALAVYLFALRRQSKLSFILFSIFSVLIHNTIIYFIFVEYIVEKIAVKWFKYLAIIGLLIAIQNIILVQKHFQYYRITETMMTLHRLFQRLSYFLMCL